MHLKNVKKNAIWFKLFWYRVFVHQNYYFLMDSILIHSNAKQTGSFNILIQSSDLIDQRDIFLFQCNSPTLWSTY